MMTMTQMQKSELEKALERLVKSGLTATRGIDRQTGKVIYGVLNREATAKAGYPVYHLVHRAADGKFHCDGVHPHCHQVGKVCVHKAAAFVAEQAAAKAQPVAAPIRSRETFRNGPTMADALATMRPHTPAQALGERVQEAW